VKHVLDLSSLVSTSIGDVPEDELQVSIQQQDGRDTWVVARECVYRGTAHPDAIGTVIRRDVWVTMKQGQAANAAASV